MHIPLWCCKSTDRQMIASIWKVICVFELCAHRLHIASSSHGSQDVDLFGYRKKSRTSQTALESGYKIFLCIAKDEIFNIFGETTILPCHWIAWANRTWTHCTCDVCHSFLALYYVRFCIGHVSKRFFKYQIHIKVDLTYTLEFNSNTTNIIWISGCISI